MGIRVLHVAPGNLFGGVERFLLSLARVAAPGSHAFAVFFHGRLEQELRDAGAQVHVLGPARMSRPWTVWRARRALQGLLRSARPDVVLCHSPWAHVATNAALGRRRTALF
ncbi:MAG: glycosyltransferase, partial [Myxococcaceae bacterium]|nr:glycosyltransferase [Myxococcaceae bacterium]